MKHNLYLDVFVTHIEQSDEKTTRLLNGSVVAAACAATSSPSFMWRLTNVDTETTMCAYDMLLLSLSFIVVASVSPFSLVHRDKTVREGKSKAYYINCLFTCVFLCFFQLNPNDDREGK